MKSRAACIAIILVGLLNSPASAQCQKQKLVAAEGQQWDEMGWAVAISGDWAAAGAPYADDVEVQSGAVYVFHRVGATWLQTQRLKASDAAFGAIFGSSIAMSGETLVIGAPGDSPQGVSWAGSTYVFTLVGRTWTQSAKLNPTPLHSGDGFGQPVAISGHRVLIGAPEDASHGLESGAAYIFDLVAGTWVQAAKLVGDDVQWSWGPNLSVSLDGDQAMLGVPAYSFTGQGQYGVGAVFVFQKGPSGWTQTQRILASDAVAYDYFGWSVAVLGTRMTVGAPGKSHTGAGHGGVMYAFEKVGSVWSQTQEFWPDDAAGSDGLGSVMTLSSDHVITNSNAAIAGSAFDLRLSGSTWIQAGKMLAADAAFSDVFGSSVAISGDTVIIGAIGCDDACPGNPNCESGAAYIFQLAPTATQYGHCPTGAPCDNPNTHGGCQNSTGNGAVLAACGSGSVTTDDLELEVTRCPPNKLTLLFMGPGQAAAVYADGIRQASPLNGVGVYRFGGLPANAQGSSIRGPGLVAQSLGFPQLLGHIQPGQTWNFQIWYRDPQGPCQGFSNFSNGVEVAFTP
jgi:hypothetical protein